MWGRIGVLLLLIGWLSCETVQFRPSIFQNAVLDASLNGFHSKWMEPLSDGMRRKSVEPPLLVGSFNIQTFGKRKFEDTSVLIVVEKIIRRYDLILVMELMTKDNAPLERLLRDVNRFAEPGVVYNMTLSDRHPQTNEFCAFFYRTDKLKLLRKESYDDSLSFYRKPFVVIFNSPTLRDLETFGVIGHHVKPSKAVHEINALADLYDIASQKYRVKDFVLMGDFNADCSYVGENEWDKISLWTRSDFTWLIGNYVDTTTNHKSCALDRIVYAGEKLNDGVILSSARVFTYQEEYELTTEQVRAISDHWPIEFQIRGKLSPEAEKHLSSDVCFSLRDSRRKPSIPSTALSKLKRTFNVTVRSSGTLLKNTTRDIEGVLSAAHALRLVLFPEQVDAIQYKIDHGALNDDSSFADVSRTTYTLKTYVGVEFSDVSVCRTTSVN